jgi:hypothetical protein
MGWCEPAHTAGNLFADCSPHSWLRSGVPESSRFFPSKSASII